MCPLKGFSLFTPKPLKPVCLNSIDDGHNFYRRVPLQVIDISHATNIVPIHCKQQPLTSHTKSDQKVPEL